MRCCLTRMGQFQRQVGCLQHWCRPRRRLASMVGVCATTTSLLTLFYFFYASSSPLSPSRPLAARAPPSSEPGDSEDVHNNNYFHHMTEDEEARATLDATGGVTTVTQSSRSADSYGNNYDGEDSVYYDNRVRSNVSLKVSSKTSGEVLPQSKEVNKPLFLPRINFVKEKYDVLSTKGDASDYLFPACQGEESDMLNDTYGFLGPFRYLANYKNPCWMEPGTGDVPTVLCVPYFYLVGAPKAGSTDLYKRIAMHPEVANPVSKETRWFDRKRFLDKPHFSSFLSNFDTASRIISRTLEKGTNYHKRIVGDGSPSYFFDNRNWPLVPGNEGCDEPRVTVASHIHHLYPGAKIIFILRNPVDRLYSSYLYNHAKYEAVSSRSFALYVREAIKVYKDCFDRFSVRVCANNATVFQQAKVMLIVSLYSVFVQDWMELFPRNQLLFITTEQYNKDMDTYLRKIYNFLGLRPLTWGEMEGIRMHSPYNQGTHYAKIGPMLKETRDLLDDFYRPYNHQLANMLNDPEFLWMS